MGVNGIVASCRNELEKLPQYWDQRSCGFSLSTGTQEMHQSPEYYHVTYDINRQYDPYGFTRQDNIMVCGVVESTKEKRESFLGSGEKNCHDEVERRRKFTCQEIYDGNQ